MNSKCLILWLSYIITNISKFAWYLERYKVWSYIYSAVIYLKLMSFVFSCTVNLWFCGLPVALGQDLYIYLTSSFQNWHLHELKQYETITTSLLKSCLMQILNPLLHYTGVKLCINIIFSVRWSGNWKNSSYKMASSWVKWGEFSALQERRMSMRKKMEVVN